MTSPDEALHGLVQRGVLSADQAAAVREVLATTQPATTSGPPRWLAEAAGYVGGVLMFGGAAVLLATEWESMTRLTRSASLGAVTVLLLGAAALTAGLGPRTPARRRIAGVLTAIASGTAAVTAGVLAEHRTGTAAGLTGLAVAAVGYAMLRTVPVLLAAGVLTVVSAVAITDEELHGTPLRMTFAFLVAGVAWLVLSLTGVVAPKPVGVGIAAAIALTGGQLGLNVWGASWWGYGLTFAVSVACFILYRSQRLVVLLIAGVVGVALAAPEAVWDWTDGAAGGALILLLAGATLIAASMLGLGLWRRRSSR